MGALDACRHGELGRAVGEKHALRLGFRGGGEGLVGTEVPARLPVVDAPSSVASQTKRSLPRASLTRRSLGPLSPE